MQSLLFSVFVTFATVCPIVLTAVSQSASQNCTAFFYPSTVWPVNCIACNNTQQSPINIVSSAAVTPSGNLSAWHTNLTLSPNASWNSVNFTLTNTGEAMRLNFNNLIINVTGLNLPGTYIAAQMHWHWGENSSLGSEHTLDGKRFVMEGHLVTYNSIYSSFNAALGMPYGIAVIAVWYQESSGADNPLFMPVSNAAVNIPYQGSTATVPGFNVYNLLPTTFFPYFRYYGSLTTPGCQQNVTWTLINTNYTVSSYQMYLIRNSMFYPPHASQSYEPLVNNFRYTQSLNGRTVYKVTAGCPTLYASSLTTVLLAFLVAVLALAKSD